MISKILIFLAGGFVGIILMGILAANNVGDKEDEINALNEKYYTKEKDNE